MKKWETLASGYAFNNKWFKVRQDKVRLPDGKIINDFFVWEEQNVAQIFALTKDKKIILVKQYKHAAGKTMIELPAGYVEQGEDFKKAAIRELEEETGYSSESMYEIGEFTHNPTKSSGIVKVFLAEVGDKQIIQNPDVNEEIEVLKIDIDKVVSMIYKGEIWATGTVASIFLALNKLKYKI